MTQLGIFADFSGPNFPGGAISVDEYKEVVAAFPRLGFKEEVVQLMCGMCREKPEVTYDNFVGEFGLKFGLDGKGGGKEKYTAAYEENRRVNLLLGGLDACAEYE